MARLDPIVMDVTKNVGVFTNSVWENSQWCEGGIGGNGEKATKRMGQLAFAQRITHVVWNRETGNR